MSFKNYLLTTGDTIDLSPHMGGTLVNPTDIVIHYTGSGGSDGKGDVSWFKDKTSKVSAHFVIGRDGGVTQCVPINRQAWHAGSSSWRGRANCNGFTIGIELDNWGKLERRVSGKFYSATGALVNPDDVVELPFVTGGPKMFWERFTAKQIDAAVELGKRLFEALPSLTGVTRHQDISPGRKIDPGPAFDLARYVGRIEDMHADVPEIGLNANGQCQIMRTVIASRLNIRSGPGTEFDTLGQFGKDSNVVIVQTGVRWWMVQGTSTAGDNVSGWVDSAYLGMPLAYR